jgi:hypothetical protein
MFAGITSLLKFLKKSFQIETLSNNHDEQQFQTAVINGIGKKNNKFYVLFIIFNRRFCGKITGFSNDGNNAIYCNIITNT